MEKIHKIYQIQFEIEIEVRPTVLRHLASSVVLVDVSPYFLCAYRTLYQQSTRIE